MQLDRTGHSAPRKAAGGLAGLLCPAFIYYRMNKWYLGPSDRKKRSVGSLLAVSRWGCVRQLVKLAVDLACNRSTRL